MDARQRAKHSTKDLPIPTTTVELGFISITDEKGLPSNKSLILERDQMEVYLHTMKEFRIKHLKEHSILMFS